MKAFVAQTEGGFAESEGAPVMEFVSSGEGLQLSLAFMKIKDPKVRKRVLDLVKSLAEEVVERLSDAILCATLFPPGPTGLRGSSARHRHPRA